jgi:hypothetical protein
MIPLGSVFIGKKLAAPISTQRLAQALGLSPWIKQETSKKYE